MNFTTIALLATGAVGMLGWFFAWRARGDVVDAQKAVQAAIAGETAAKGLAFEADARAVASGAQLTAAKMAATGLQNQLDAERKSRQDLVDALARSGAPVGDVLVGSALDGMYPDGDQGGAGASPSPGGSPVGVPGQSAAIARTTTRR